MAKEKKKLTNRDKIIAKARELFLTKGYENTSIQDFLDALDIAKGTFYHYFKSKIEVLHALLEQMSDTLLPILEGVVYDESLNALEKIQKMFATAQMVKFEQPELMAASIEALYMPSNILFLQTFQNMAMDIVRPLYGHIFQQGKEEGTFPQNLPDNLVDPLYAVFFRFGYVMGQLMLGKDPRGLEGLREEYQMIHYTFNQMLGLTDKQIVLFEMDRLELLFQLLEERRKA
jgi:AcrR family transcriptional regulator